MHTGESTIDNMEKKSTPNLYGKLSGLFSDTLLTVVAEEALYWLNVNGTLTRLVKEQDQINRDKLLRIIRNRGK